MLAGETILNLESRSPQGIAVGLLLAGVLVGGFLAVVRLRRELEG